MQDAEQREQAPGGVGVQFDLPLQALAQELQREEGAVTLVEVEDLGRLAQRAQEPHAADAEDDLLADAPVEAALVELPRERAEVLRVALVVGVEQVKRRAAELELPGAELQRARAEVDGDLDGLAVVARDELEGVVLRVDGEVAVLLPAVESGTATVPYVSALRRPASGPDPSEVSDRIIAEARIRKVKGLAYSASRTCPSDRCASLAHRCAWPALAASLAGENNGIGAGPQRPACQRIRRIVMSQVIAFPRVAKTAAPNAATGVSAEVHRLLPDARRHELARRPAGGADLPPLSALVAQMRADSQDLARSLADLQAAVKSLADADLPGQARDLVAAVTNPGR